MKKVVNILRKIGKAYLDSVVSYYRPMVDSKINPLI